LHQVGVSFDLYYDARKHKIKNLCSLLLDKWQKLLIFITSNSSKDCVRIM